METIEQNLLTSKESTPIFKDACAEIYHIVNDNIICVVMKGLTKNQCYQLNAERALTTLQRFKSTKILMDFSSLVMMSPDDQRWTEDIWQSQAVKMGLKYMATVSPDNLFASLSINKLMENIKRNASFENVNFTNKTEAYEWLSA
jgi:hypothetical protein